MQRSTERAVQPQVPPHLRTGRDLQQGQSQPQAGGSGLLFLQSLVFFAIMVAIFIVVWATTKLVCRILMRFAPESPAQRRSQRQRSTNEAGVRWTERDMRQLREWRVTNYPTRQLGGAEGPTPAGPGGGPRNLFSAEDLEGRKEFLEHALLNQAFEPPPPGSATTPDEPLACPICLDEFQKGDRVSGSFNRRCPHKFHHDCILDWLVHDDSCPCCRQSFSRFRDDRDISDKAPTTEEASDAAVTNAPEPIRSMSDEETGAYLVEEDRIRNDTTATDVSPTGSRPTQEVG